MFTSSFTLFGATPSFFGLGRSKIRRARKTTVAKISLATTKSLATTDTSKTVPRKSPRLNKTNLKEEITINTSEKKSKRINDEETENDESKSKKLKSNSDEIENNIDLNDARRLVKKAIARNKLETK